ncbi:MAG: hypothetical protein L3J87_04010 [Thermoplasmata archaeon]|nr:hypothetical protein [Thermoplasmata archaeon]
MRSPRWGSPGPKLRPVVAAAFLAVVALLSVTPAAGTPVSTLTVRPSAALEQNGVVGTLDFGGFNTSGAGSPSTALTIAPGAVAATFHWLQTVSSVGGGRQAIAQAQLVAVVLGFSAFTRVQVLSPPDPNATGWINLSSDFSEVRYLAEGLYEVTGSLVAQGGSTLWQQSFYVHVVSPYHLVAINVLLVAIAIYEIYSIAKLGSTKSVRKPETSPTPPEAMPEELANEAGKGKP